MMSTETSDFRKERGILTSTVHDDDDDDDDDYDEDDDDVV
jgi:hypothetical protein